ncbi:MAG: hypothetical protein KGJ07_00035 [Patescibacteria group bacterium]|nr:hypothetical protein [Patescibacteria group bacterium]
MNHTEKKPSEKLMKNPIDGLEVTDSLGRVLRLRKPDILDHYDLFSAIGEDTRNPACIMMATKVLYVATIDNQVVECPKSLKEFRATLKRIGEEGIFAVDEILKSLDDGKDEKEVLAQVKK